MSNFPVWFNRAYKRWSRSQPGEEDFLAFCDLLGYPSAKVLGWLHGEAIPEGSEVLNIAGSLGIEVYAILGLPEANPELLKIFNAFPHLRGNFRSNLAQALWEAQTEMEQKSVPSNSDEAKSILSEAFKKWELVA